VLASTFEGDIECVVAISAPVAAVPDELSKKITGRKLFVFADRDPLRLMPNVMSCFAAASAPKKLVLFGGREHSRAMFSAPYGDDAQSEIVEFVCRRGRIRTSPASRDFSARWESAFASFARERD